MVVIKEGVVLDNPASYIALDEWLENPQSNGGVLLRSDQSPDLIADKLEQFPVIAIEFPVFSDGRGFSYARQLREEYGYKGEIRAVGHLIRDQYLFLHRCGFDSIEVSDESAVEDWQTAMNEITLYFQKTVDERQPVSVLRRWLNDAHDLKQTESAS